MTFDAGRYQGVRDDGQGHGLLVELGAYAGQAEGGVGIANRFKVGEEYFHYGLVPQLYAVGPKDSFLNLFLRGGLALLQFENIGGESTFGMFSPIVTVGFALGYELRLHVGIGVEYDVRFTGPSSSGGAWFLTIGSHASMAD